MTTAEILEYLVERRVSIIVESGHYQLQKYDITWVVYSLDPVTLLDAYISMECLIAAILKEKKND